MANCVIIWWINCCGYIEICGMFTSILSALSQHKINSSASAHIVLLDGTCPVFTYKFTHNALFFIVAENA